jgi:hypothetical protein
MAVGGRCPGVGPGGPVEHRRRRLFLDGTRWSRSGFGGRGRRRLGDDPLDRLHGLVDRRGGGRAAPRAAHRRGSRRLRRGRRLGGRPGAARPPGRAGRRRSLDLAGSGRRRSLGRGGRHRRAAAPACRGGGDHLGVGCSDLAGGGLRDGGRLAVRLRGSAAPGPATAAAAGPPRPLPRIPVDGALDLLDALLRRGDPALDGHVEHGDVRRGRGGGARAPAGCAPPGGRAGRRHGLGRCAGRCVERAEFRRERHDRRRFYRRHASRLVDRRRSRATRTTRPAHRRRGARDR